ncbi:MAG TPA: alpha/beta hydrolase [Ktedonobacteraceae bacterium]
MEEKTRPILINIGERRLAMRVQGDRAPTVVLEMGLGCAGRMYDAIPWKIATFARVIWYDRAGLGQSDPAPTPRTIRDLVLDLHALLQKAELSGPFVLAGHSMGGQVTRLYREWYPEEVAALVLIDASHEDQRERYLAFWLLHRQANCPILPICVIFGSVVGEIPTRTKKRSTMLPIAHCCRAVKAWTICRWWL